jgi:hypothetical protein
LFGKGLKQPATPSKLDVLGVFTAKRAIKKAIFELAISKKR